MNPSRWITLGVVSLFLCTCLLPLGAEAKRKKPAQEETAADASPYTATQEAGYTKIAVDIDGDGSGDIWNFYPDGADVASSHPVRREIDLNRDGRPDVITHFSGDVMVREVIDADFDGDPDWVDFYESGKRVRSEWDTDFDGRPDLFKYYDRGQIERIEQDSQLPRDGQIDYWEYYENGVMQRAGRDVDGDGKIDEWGE